uniref:NHL repeat-containing protein 2 isoform X2 n=1 Tax=Rhizophora mucronata TaxID=61149 RepID=A0A2P2MLJ6_RHIMU
MSSREPGNPIPEFGFAYLSKYISKNLFLAASGLNAFTPLTLATPPKKFASPVPINGTKSSTVTSTPISAKTSTAAILEGSSLLHNTPSMSKRTADTFPHSPPPAASSGSFFCSTLTQAFTFTTVLLVKAMFFDLNSNKWTLPEMGFGPFGLGVKNNRELGCGREEHGDNNFTAMTWLLEDKLMMLWMAGKECFGVRLSQVSLNILVFWYAFDDGYLYMVFPDWLVYNQVRL